MVTKCRYAACTTPLKRDEYECTGFCDMTAARNFVDGLDDLSIERLVQAGLERGRVRALRLRVEMALHQLDLIHGHEPVTVIEPPPGCADIKP